MSFSDERLEKFKKYTDLREEIFSEEEQKELDAEIKLEIDRVTNEIFISTTHKARG